jgi:hypothetical protein
VNVKTVAGRKQNVLQTVSPTYQVLYGCGNWSLTLREEHRLRMFENRVVRRIFGWKREKVTGGWRKLYN